MLSVDIIKVSHVTDWVNSVTGREVEVSSATIQTNAMSLAKLGSILMSDKSDFISQNTLIEAISKPKFDYDPFLDSSYSFTKGGFAMFDDMQSKLVSATFNEDFHGFYGWCGRGGSWFIFNPSKKVSLSYVMNGLGASSVLGGPRSDRIMNTVQKIIRRL